MRHIKKYNEGIFDFFKEKVNKKDLILNRLEEHFKFDNSISDIFKKSKPSYKEDESFNIKYVKTTVKNLKSEKFKVKITIEDTDDKNKLFLTIQIYGNSRVLDKEKTTTLSIYKKQNLDSLVNNIIDKVESLENDFINEINEVLDRISARSTATIEAETKNKKIKEYIENFYNEFSIEDLKDILYDLNDLLDTPKIDKINGIFDMNIGYRIEWKITGEIPKNGKTDSINLEEISNYFNYFKECFTLIKELGDRVKSEFKLNTKYEFVNDRTLHLFLYEERPIELRISRPAPR